MRSNGLETWILNIEKKITNKDNYLVDYIKWVDDETKRLSYDIESLKQHIFISLKDHIKEAIKKSHDEIRD